MFKPALESAGYEVSRADDLFTPSPIMLDIQRSILESQLILCDMSEKSPNVFYELGLAHAVGRPVILVSRKADDILFDLRHVRIILYDYTAAGWEEKLRTAITAAAKTVEGDDEVWPPPLVKQNLATMEKVSIADSAADLLEKVRSLFEDIQSLPDSDKILKLGMDSFRRQDDKIPRQFNDMFERLGLHKNTVNGLGSLLDLDDHLFMTYKIPFQGVEEAMKLWFVNDGLRSNAKIKVRDYEPPQIRGDDRTKLDDWSLALHTKALVEAPDVSLNQYVSDLIAVWRKNYDKYNEFICFWNSVEFDNKYMDPKQFFAQRGDFATRFCELYDEIRTYLEPGDYGFGKPYHAGEYIKRTHGGTQAGDAQQMILTDCGKPLR